MVGNKKKVDVERKGLFFILFVSLGRFFLFLIKVPYFIVKYFVLLLRFLFNKRAVVPSVKDVNEIRGIIKDVPVEVVSFDVLKTIKGSYDSFFDYLKSNDSFIAITIGARGSGKTAVSLSFLEALRGSKKRYYAMGFSREALPEWIFLVDDASKIKNDSLVVVDEGGILFSSRESMSDANKVLSDLLMISRHKNISIVFISQNSSNLDINTLRQADVLILKKNSLLQKSFERKIIAKLYEEHESLFEKYKSNKGMSLVYSDSFVGAINVGLPSFWSRKTSKSFEKVESQVKSKDSNKSLK